MTYASVGGQPVGDLRVYVPGQGPWFADADLLENPVMSGRVTIAIGELDLVGTVDERYAGEHALERRVRIVGGAGGWGGLLPPKGYHGDAGVRAVVVATDAAREVGETLGAFAPGAERVGVDYVRQAGPASRVLEDVIGGVSWWVGYDGATNVGERPVVTPRAGSYEVLEYDPRSRLVVLALDDVRDIAIGSQLTERLDAPQTVRELVIAVTADAVRVTAWCGGSAGSRGRLPDLMRSLVDRMTDGPLYGLWRYRVTEMDGDRVELQAIKRDAGLPDILPISMRPGVAGAHAELAPGAEVLVQFIEGDRAQPVITHFAGREGPGFEPVKLHLDASTGVLIGAAAATEPLVLGNALVTWLNSHVHATAMGPSAVPTVPAGAAQLSSKHKVEG